MTQFSNRRVDRGSHSVLKGSYKAPSIRPPSYSETKKITVTVPGLHKPSSHEPYMYRREERLAAAIAKSKDLRQQSYMRTREETLASTITSAFSGGASGIVERERVPVHHHYSSRSPSPPPSHHIVPHAGVGGYETQYVSRSAAASMSTKPKNLTTMTTMTISNLSDTVSKSDVAELCSAVGPVDAIYLTAPGVAEVVFRHKDDALEAYKKYNQRNLDGQPMMCRLQPTIRSRPIPSSSAGYSSGRLDAYPSDIYGGSGYL